jgi:prepilin-type N-terminal cleavage/methylation domain-containing protein
MLGLQRHKRAGISLIEVLVVLAVLAAIAGWLMMAMPQARMAAAQSQCQNNLRQIGIAMHNINDSRGKLPPIVGPMSANEKGYGTIFYHFLPYIEQDPLYKTGVDKDGGYYVWNRKVFSNRVKTYLCPDDKSGPENGLYKDYLAPCNYAGNWQVFGEGNARIPATFQDGTSNTIAFTERYQMCHGTPMAWGYPGLYYWSPTFAYYSHGKFHTTPSQEECDPALAQTPHRAGIAVGMGDASSRTVSPDLSNQTWWAACTPAAGDILGADW